MRRIDPKYIVLISDAVIPLLGFFLWNWSLYFILLFYALDLLAREVITHVKTRIIYEAQHLKSREKWMRNGVVSAVLLAGVLAGVHGAVFFIAPGIDFGKELLAFWNYEEMGIQQGYILLPLVGYAAFMQYRMEFVMTGKARVVLMDSLWKQHQKALLFMIAGCTLSIGIALAVMVPEWVYVLGVVGASAAYTYFLKK